MKDFEKKKIKTTINAVKVRLVSICCKKIKKPMNNIYSEELKNEELTSKTKQPRQEIVNAILNFSKSYNVEKSKHVGQVEMILN